MTSKYDTALVTLTQRYEQSLWQTDKIFAKFRKDLTEAEERISTDIRKFYENEVQELDKSKGELEKESTLLEKEIKTMEDKMDTLEKVKVIEDKV
jgi:predicted  nucleic acid-binding Zn-ribbon protein